ncbi:MOSC domain-containing protein [Bacillus thermotolerans]|uniref:MOSC domain-containing protein n=1 Tax=Bacillus thermotolerans TaxID=1221996 RepID=A0A0F5I4D2_BACTR|nr:MOSC domain-containing protein [Bacillus thermotolerans]KKB40115.1 hypothetical protein QY95_01854 [Bacillus thermotolerans]KKB43093.1 hypothetical protein QY96_00980 [Bacillus thermotolerans]
MSISIKEIFVGRPKTVGQKEAASPMDREWTSGIFKEPAQGAVWLSRTNLAGDGQADLKNHGGPDKAVLAYPAVHYSAWKEELENTLIPVGGMGENFSLEGITEDQVSIGDIFQLDEAVVQVSQPRKPCWKPARRFKVKDLALRIQRTGRTGWYLRVLQEGRVQAGQALTLIERPLPEWTVARCNKVMYAKEADIADLEALAECELLASSWRDSFKERIEKQER